MKMRFGERLRELRKAKGFTLRDGPCALEVNDSAVQVLGDQTLRTIARESATRPISRRRPL
jgi:transcriptional regulator with XRE-family HTH domain